MKRMRWVNGQVQGWGKTGHARTGRWTGRGDSWPAGRRLGSLVAALLVSAWGAATAQTEAPAASPSPATSPPPAAPAAPATSERVEVRGQRQSDTELRRESTAAKIIIGRDQIEQYGDSNLGELLKRLPGVTTDGRPGRGGGPRMRGLGSGYTQILVDGERIQGGLSLDSIDPDQVERIEILRAPTAETGARAIGGTINIVTRDGFTRKLNDLTLGVGLENGRASPGVSWNREDRWGDMNYNLSLALRERHGLDEGVERVEAPGIDQTESSVSSSSGRNLHANARLRWRLDQGGQLMLMPLAVLSQWEGRRRSQVLGVGDIDYARSQGANEGQFSLLRLNGMGRWALPDGGWLELRGGAGQGRSRNDAQRQAFAADDTLLTTRDEHRESRETNANLQLKYSSLLAENHQFVAGIEAEAGQRDEVQDIRDNGQPQLSEFGNNLSARSRRLAAYAQDEWSISKQWAVHAGLRWEGIRTEGQTGEPGGDARNHSGVWTPLLHTVWKFDPQGKDQLRLSLTRSYRAPTLQNLLGRPSISSRFPLPGDNSPTSPDRAGNPALAPELATGIDLALERYLPAGGLLSVNLFHRRIQDLIRTVTTLESVSWSDTPRWVARPQNLGDAWTQGLEMEAKFRLSEVWAGAPALDLRANASLFRSRVLSVPGPDNRLDQQPGATANLGADYRIPGSPITVGGNLNLTPGYTTRLSETQWLIQPRKRVLEAYALWALRPDLRLRLSANNLAPEDAWTRSTVADETATTTNRTWVNWRLQLEAKL